MQKNRFLFFIFKVKCFNRRMFTALFSHLPSPPSCPLQDLAQCISYNGRCFSGSFMTRTLMGMIAPRGGIGRHLNLILDFIWSGGPGSTLLGRSGLGPQKSICSFNATWTHLNGAPSTDVPQRFCGTPAIPTQDQVKPTNTHGDLDPQLQMKVSPRMGCPLAFVNFPQKWKPLKMFGSISLGILVHLSMGQVFCFVFYNERLQNPRIKLRVTKGC